MRKIEYLKRGHRGTVKLFSDAAVFLCVWYFGIARRGIRGSMNRGFARPDKH